MVAKFGLLLSLSIQFAYSADPTPITADSTACHHVVVLEDIRNGGWYDGCEGLTKHPDNLDSSSCETACKTDLNCSVWQMTNNSAGEPLACWYGSATHGCRSRGAGFNHHVMGGQRVQHGEVDLVSDNTGKATAGLLFMAENPGTTGDKDALIARCKAFCYTDVTCTVWQYGGDGCHIEHFPGYPAGSTTVDARIVAGETVKHMCPPPDEHKADPWRNVMIGCAIASLVLAALTAAYVLHNLQLCKGPPKVKKTRQVKIVPKTQEAPNLLFQIQPQVSVVMQPMMQPVMQTTPLLPTAQTAPMAMPTMTSGVPMMTTGYGGYPGL